MNKHLSRLLNGFGVLIISAFIVGSLIMLGTLFGPLAIVLVLVAPFAYLLGWISE